MRLAGFTRASTLGPIIEVISEAGGSAERVFQRADLPLGLQQAPETLVPLKDHFNLLRLAARELGDELFGARLGQAVTMRNLGAYGAWVTQAPTLLDALRRADRSLGYMLQSATVLRLRAQGRRASWSYQAMDGATDGRQQNEVLALFHMIEIVRAYLGPGWWPDRVAVSGGPVRARAELERMLGADVEIGAEAGAIAFDRRLLATRRPAMAASAPTLADLDRALSVPRSDDIDETVTALIELELIERLPTIGWVARKAGLSERSLQRHLARRGTQFSELAQAAIERRAFDLLLDSNLSITQIAAALGYSDAAHLSRAFKRWTGQSPQAWRNAAG